MGTSNLRRREEKYVCILLVQSPRDVAFGRTEIRFEVNIRLNLKEIGCEDVDGIQLTHECPVMHS
jgi:hypothetical protein